MELPHVAFIYFMTSAFPKVRLGCVKIHEVGVEYFVFKLDFVTSFPNVSILKTLLHGVG
jgi:hypothetical protein